VIQGERIRFSREGVWLDANKQPLPNNLQLIVHDVVRVVQKWGHDNMPAEDPIILGPNQAWPDIQAKNDACPKTEWFMRFGELKGPYQPQKAVYLWDPVTMNKYTWATSSSSGMTRVSEFVEKVQTKRQFKKLQAFAVVKLGSRLWSKRYNTPGPELIVVQWLFKNEEGALLPMPGETLAITGEEATGDEVRF
jgi:hypothetical protein